MYQIHDGNTTIYETLGELLNEEILQMSEDRNFYYVILTKEAADDSVWKVDKKTGKASYMQYVIYLELEIDCKVTPVDPEILRKQRVS